MIRVDRLPRFNVLCVTLITSRILMISSFSLPAKYNDADAINCNMNIQIGIKFSLNFRLKEKNVIETKVKKQKNRFLHIRHKIHFQLHEQSDER